MPRPILAESKIHPAIRDTITNNHADANGSATNFGGGLITSYGAYIANSVIGARVDVRHPIRITNSVIMPGVVVDSTTDLDAVVMSGEHSIHCPAAASGPHNP